MADQSMLIAREALDLIAVTHHLDSCAYIVNDDAISSDCSCHILIADEAREALSTLEQWSAAEPAQEVIS